MQHHRPIIALSVLSLATIDVAYAGMKHRHHRGAPAAVAWAPSFEPARMIEVRPGLIISSYDCFTDEGYGRYSPCNGNSKR